MAAATTGRRQPHERLSPPGAEPPRGLDPIDSICSGRPRCAAPRPSPAPTGVARSAPRPPRRAVPRWRPAGRRRAEAGPRGRIVPGRTTGGRRGRGDRRRRPGAGSPHHHDGRQYYRRPAPAQPDERLTATGRSSRRASTRRPMSAGRPAGHLAERGVERTVDVDTSAGAPGPSLIAVPQPCQPLLQPPPRLETRYLAVPPGMASRAAISRYAVPDARAWIAQARRQCPHQPADVGLSAAIKPFCVRVFCPPRASALGRTTAASGGQATLAQRAPPRDREQPVSAGFPVRRDF